MQRKNTTLISKLLQRVSFAVILLLIWQAAYVVGVNYLKIWKPYAMPSPKGVWNSFLTLAKGDTLVLAILTSLKRIAVGYSISVVLGAVIGFLITKFKYLNRNAKPFILGMQTLPSICWVPFAILWYGISEDAIVFVIVVGSAFGIGIAVENAIQNIEPIYLRAARTMGAKGSKLYFKVILPAGLPELVSGLKQGWSFAWRALMSGEMMSATLGLGHVLLMGRDLANINQVMVVMVLIVLLGTLIDKLFFEQIENRIREKMGLNKDKQPN